MGERSTSFEEVRTLLYLSIGSREFVFLPPSQWIACTSLRANNSNGIAVLISRTDPLVDPVLEDGKTGVPEQKLEWVKAQVYSVSSQFIRIQTEVPIEHLKHGRWR